MGHLEDKVPSGCPTSCNPLTILPESQILADLPLSNFPLNRKGQHSYH